MERELLNVSLEKMRQTFGRRLALPAEANERGKLERVPGNGSGNSPERHAPLGIHRRGEFRGDILIETIGDHADHNGGEIARARSL